MNDLNNFVILILYCGFRATQLSETADEKHPLGELWSIYSYIY